MITCAVAVKARKTIANGELISMIAGDRSAEQSSLSQNNEHLQTASGGWKGPSFKQLPCPEQLVSHGALYSKPGL